MRDQLLKAETLEALEGLRKTYSKYNNASPNTRGKWRKAYNMRKTQLKPEEAEA
jgi:hypothetical protein